MIKMTLNLLKNALMLQNENPSALLEFHIKQKCKKLKRLCINHVQNEFP